MQTYRQNRPRKFSPSFALISVLALVSLAALTATAFLASARLERQATSSIGNATRLEMALDSGKICASQVIGDNTQPDVGNTHVILYWRTNWTDELGYPFIGQIRTNGGRDSAIWHYFPLFSPAGLTNLDTNVYQTAMRWTNTHQGTFSDEMRSNMATKYANTFVANPGLNHPTCVQIPLLGGRTSPPVGWVYMNKEMRKLGTTNTTSSPVVRIAWFTEDLEGLIDAERMGATTSRSTGTNAEEVSLASASDSSGALIASVANFTNNRKAYISYGLLSSTSVSGLANPTNARYFASGLRSWTSANPASPTNGALEWIPVGIPISGTSSAPLGYTNQGYTKLNLNNFVPSTNSADDVANIASVIANNLPLFGNRAGAMNSGAYISNIAANIVDYVDTNTIPLVDSSNAIPTWRGVEAIAWPNEVFTRIHLSNRVTTNANYEFEVIVKNSVEVWNLSSTPIVVDGTNYSISNNLNIPIRCQNWYGNLSNNTTGKTAINEVCTNAPFTLPPNSYGVLSAPSRNLKFNVPIALAPGAGVGMTIHSTPNKNNTYNIYYKNKIIDATPAGRVTPKSTNLLTSQSCVFANAVNFGISDDLGLTYNLAAGDPRGGLFIQRPAMDFELNETTPGGRNLHASSSGGAKIVDPAVNWPDGGHSSTLDTVTAPTTTTVPQGLQKQGNTNHWVQKINNSGKMTNIMELGNIFDPIQWGDPNNPFFYRDTAAWMGLSNSATPFSGACGRTTLRIGRPEHQRFAFTNMYNGPNEIPIPNMGMSSAALLDLFCLTNGTNPAGGPSTLGGGKINLNTAPAPVLRALAGGILLTNDPALVNISSAVTASHSVPAGMAEAFAQGVMRFRSKYPFLTPSHLAFIGTDPSWPNTSTWPANAVFGNTNTIALATGANAPGNTAGSSTRVNVKEWNDQAAEEWFSKIFALSSYQSHNFRIYVVAQLVSTNSSGQTNAIGPLAKKYYQIYARNTNNSSVTNSITNTICGNQTIYTWTPAINTIDILKSTY